MIDPTSSETIGYHLFLEPVGVVAKETRRIIQKLSQEYGGPTFEPHVTLLARIPKESEDTLFSKTAILAEKFSPLTLTLGELDMQDAYFKALYIKIREQEEMMQWHTLANEVFSMKDEGEYIAHLSLLYGTYPSAQKENTMAQLPLPTEKSFLVDRIHLYRTEGAAPQWYKVQEFMLNKDLAL